MSSIGRRMASWAISRLEGIGFLRSIACARHHGDLTGRGAASPVENDDDGHSPNMLGTRTALSCMAIAGGVLAVPAAASAGIFGTDPLAISIDPSAGAPNGPSGHAAVSGDNRKTRLAAFDSTATNLVAGDANGQ